MLLEIQCGLAAEIDEIGGVEEIAGEHPEDRYFTGQRIDHFDPRILLVDQSDLVAAGVGDRVAGLPDRARPRAVDCPDRLTAGCGDCVIGVEVEDPVGVDPIEGAGLRLVSEYGDIFLQLERLLFDISDELAAGVGDSYLRVDRHDLERQFERIVEHMTSLSVIAGCVDRRLRGLKAAQFVIDLSYAGD